MRGPTASTSGLIAWLGDIPVGWCAAAPRSDLIGLVRVFTVPWKDRDEDRCDPSVCAVTNIFSRVGYRRRGIASALIRGTPAHATAGGARAVEGYPTRTTAVIGKELHVGTVPMFGEAGFRQVSPPPAGASSCAWSCEMAAQPPYADARVSPQRALQLGRPDEV